MSFRRLSASLLLAGLALVATATPAMAHTSLKSSNPAEGASLSAAPTQIELRFAEAVILPADPIKVTGPNGAQWTVGAPTIAGAVITAPVQPTGPAGEYTITYKVIADDGDQISGRVRFTLTEAAVAVATGTSATPSPSPSPTTSQPATSSQAPAPAAQSSDSDGGLPGWVWILIAVAVLAAIGVAAAIRFRRPSQD